jgi:plastocyanin
MTGFRALVMLIVIAALFLTFLPMLAITGLGDLDASNGYVPASATASPASGTNPQSNGPGNSNPRPTGIGTPPAGTGATATPAAGGAQVTVTSTKIAFDKTQIKVPAGPVTITYANKDNGVPHNFHVFNGKDANGKSLGQTDIKAGVNTQTLKLNLQKGTYYFQCDVHPQQMNGTITAT